MGKQLGVMPVTDAHLTSTTLLTALRQLLVFMTDMHFYHEFPAGSASATCFAKCIATAPQTLAESQNRTAGDAVAIQPLPGHLYSVGKYVSHSNAHKIPLGTIKHGEWTLLVLTNLQLSTSARSDKMAEQSESSPSYCFVTAKHPVVYPYMSVPIERAIVPEQFGFHDFTSFMETIGIAQEERVSLVEFWEKHLCARMHGTRTRMSMIPQQDICDIFGVLGSPKNYDPIGWFRTMRNEDPARTQPVDESDEDD